MMAGEVSSTPAWLNSSFFNWLCGQGGDGGGGDGGDRERCFVLTFSPLPVLMTALLCGCLCPRDLSPSSPPRARLKLALLGLAALGNLAASLSIDPFSSSHAPFRLPFPYIASAEWLCSWLLAAWFLLARSEHSLIATSGAAALARASILALLLSRRSSSSSSSTRFPLLFEATQILLALLALLLTLVAALTEKAQRSQLEDTLISVSVSEEDTDDAHTVPKETRNDPDEFVQGETLFPDVKGWGAWAVAYIHMHNDLVAKARAIQAQGEQRRKSDNVQLDKDFTASLRALRTDVFAYCPKRYLLLGIVFSTGLTLTSFAQPFVTGKLYDAALLASTQAEPARDWSTITLCLEMVAGLMLFNYIGNVLVGIFFALAAHTTVTRLRIKVFSNVVQQDISFFDGHTSGELSSRLINDSAALQSLAQFTTNSTLQSIIKLVGSVLAMFTTHWFLAVIATCITPVTWQITKWTGTTVGYYSAVQNEAMAKANSLAVEVLGSVRTVHSNAAEEREAQTFEGVLNKFLRIIKFTLYAETSLRFTRTGLSQARDFVVLIVGMHLVVQGRMTLGGFVAFNTYVGLYEAGFGSLADLWISLKRTIASTGRFLQLLQRLPDIRPDVGDTPQYCYGTLAFENVSFAYAAAPTVMVLQDISFVAKPGTVTALVGESGAGKSTIGRLIERFYDPCSGRVAMDGIDCRDLSLRWLRRQIGFVEQEPVLFDRSVRENIVYGTAHDPSDEEVESAARLARAHDFILQLPEGYDSRPGEKGVRVSGGQKQRLAIARAIVKNPRVLLMDEATSALDSETESIVQQALDSLMEGRTTVVIAHRLSTVVRAAQILVIDKGALLERGSHATLSSNPHSRYAQFMRHQLIDTQGAAADAVPSRPPGALV